jgi:hypothetical protein
MAQGWELLIGESSSEQVMGNSEIISVQKSAIGEVTVRRIGLGIEGQPF